MRFAGLALHDAVPDAKTIWLDREQLTRACALARLFARFDAMLAERGFLAMGGQIVDASVVEARRPRLTKEEKAVLRGGGTPADWSRASARQIDRDGRWTRRRGRKTRPPEGGSAPRQAAAEMAVPVFGWTEGDQRSQEPSRHRPRGRLHSPFRRHRRGAACGRRSSSAPSRAGGPHARPHRPR